MPQNFLSRFTPSLMAPEVLEEIFVQREGLASRIVRQLRESVLGEEKHQRLIVGPRGIGKTHLVSLVYHRLRAMDDLRDQMCIAWLREEEWGISSFLDLLVRILAALDDADRDAGVRQRLSTIYATAGDGAEAAAVALLSEVLGGRALVLIVENLDEVFAGLGERGQQRFRAYLQNRRECAMLATSQALFGAVWLEASPFFGFFQVTHLKEFDVDAASALLLKLARLMDDDELASLLATPVGRSRLEALHHLVGGNPRLYVILAQFLTRESLDALVDAFFEALDELTPYYRERMKSLSALQQKLVYLLSESGAPVSVKALAERSFTSQQTVSSQLTALRKQRFVVAHPVGRESWYELREPLLRLVLRVKKERGEPIRLFVDFLRVWYSRDELTERLAALPPLSAEAGYIQRALAEPGESDAIGALVKAFNEVMDAFAWDRALELNRQLIQLRNREVDWLQRAFLLRIAGRATEALQTLDEAINRLGDTPLLAANRARVLADVGRYMEARDALETIAHVEAESPELVRARAAGWNEARDPLRSLEDYCLLSRLIPGDPGAIVGQGITLMQLGRASEAADLLSPLLPQFGANSGILITLGIVLSAAGRLKEAEEVFVRLTSLYPSRPDGWLKLAGVHLERRDFTAAMRALDQIQEPHRLPPGTESEYSYLQGLVLSGMGRSEEALPWYERAAELAVTANHRSDMKVAVINELAKLKRWADVVEQLEHGLAREEFRSAPRRALIGVTTVALSSQEEELWKQGVNELVARINDRTDRVVLGNGVLGGVNLLLRAKGAPAARKWLDAWEAAGHQYAEIHLGYRLAEVAVSYRETSDERLLLSLPMEERKVVTMLLDIPELGPEPA